MRTIFEQFKGILLGLDNAGSALLFNGQTDITISARCGMALIDQQDGSYDHGHEAEQKALLALAESLNAIERDHCLGAIIGDLRRAREAIAILEKYEERAQAWLQASAQLAISMPGG